jgi:hypothetical protein
MGAESSAYRPSGVKFPQITFNFSEGEGDQQTQTPLLPGGRVKMQLYDCGGSAEVTKICLGKHKNARTLTHFDIFVFQCLFPWFFTFSPSESWKCDIDLLRGGKWCHRVHCGQRLASLTKQHLSFLLLHSNSSTMLQLTWRNPFEFELHSPSFTTLRLYAIRWSLASARSARGFTRDFSTLQFTPLLIQNCTHFSHQIVIHLELISKVTIHFQTLMREQMRRKSGRHNCLFVYGTKQVLQTALSVFSLPNLPHWHPFLGRSRCNVRFSTIFESNAAITRLLKSHWLPCVAGNLKKSWTNCN